MHFLRHFITITKHKILVFNYCLRAGIIKQGITHDLSKYSFTEFYNGAKYYSGCFSPNHNERLDKGYSEAWMHHKGRNKHHSEYWVDIDLKQGIYVPVLMPNKYIVENICDRIAASKVYNKKNFKPIYVLDYFLKEKDRIIMHEHSKLILQKLLNIYVENGLKYILKYLKKTKKLKDFGLQI